MTQSHSLPALVSQLGAQCASLAAPGAAIEQQLAAAPRDPEVARLLTETVGALGVAERPRSRHFSMAAS
jgi:hypothetical protein